MNSDSKKINTSSILKTSSQNYFHGNKHFDSIKKLPFDI
jgi:hypothetical protein